MKVYLDFKDLDAEDMPSNISNKYNLQIRSINGGSDYKNIKIQSLADYTKQVRKKMAEQIKAVINDIDLEQDYADLLNLRNRIMEGEELYEEDHITLDHALDSLEILIKVIKILNDEKLKGEKC